MKSFARHPALICGVLAGLVLSACGGGDSSSSSKAPNGIDRAFADMDAWGYTFRLGSARAWFERDAEDAAAFLQALPHLRQMVSVPAERRV